MIDLQMHSVFSDGSLTPTELVREAKNLGLTAAALTDHDTIDGLTEFIEAGEEFGITTVPGVEISVDTRLPNNGHMHILGLFIDARSDKLRDTLNFLLTQRNLRAEKILFKLKELGVNISLKDLIAEAGEGAIGRPHVAKILVRNGVVDSIPQAFEAYLKKGGPAYVDKVKLGEKDAIDMISDAGGLAILAHPHLMNYNSFREIKEKIIALQELGLDGFEVYYSGMPKEYTVKLLELAEIHGFAISGGSDYHGANKEGIKMGTGNGDLAIPDEVCTQLKNHWLRKVKENKVKSDSI